MNNNQVQNSKNIYQRMKRLNARMVKNYQRGFGPTHITLLLTTTGRKTGLPRTTPLQYEKVGEDFFIASALGDQADWYKNICAEPRVQVRVGQREFNALTEATTDPTRIAEFLEMRLHRHPVMVRLIMHLFDGLPLRFNRVDLVNLAEKKAMVIIHPIESQKQEAPEKKIGTNP
jgi:deazaflavin-dependent oxidoreductase (nitroreductase family)